MLASQIIYGYHRFEHYLIYIAFVIPRNLSLVGYLTYVLILAQNGFRPARMR